VKRIAGIDYGSVRIGVALADDEVRIASPHENYTRVGEAADAAYFRRLVETEQISQFIVGLPIHLDGHESGKSHEARQFGRWLGETTGVPVLFFDERFTSSQAEEHLLAAGMTKKRRRGRLDKLAAQIMLTAYLEAPHLAHEQPRGIDQ
jgi:putative Holliday junction resolvase